MKIKKRKEINIIRQLPKARIRFFSFIRKMWRIEKIKFSNRRKISKSEKWIGKSVKGILNHMVKSGSIKRGKLLASNAKRRSKQKDINLRNID